MTPWQKQTNRIRSNVRNHPVSYPGFVGVLMLPIKHVFVLMLENRSFDQMLGVSPFTGVDAVTHKATQLNALPAGASNSWNGQNYPAGPPAVDPVKNDPYHEFEDVLEQLCGAGVRYPSGGPYPTINNGGFVSNFA